jgi:hypothetical protein
MSNGLKLKPEFINTKAIIHIPVATNESFAKAMEKIIELDNDPVKYREVYEQPLFKNGQLPDELNALCIREKINKRYLS